MASFEEILNLPASHIKSPQAFPVGTYHCLVEGPPNPGKSKNDNNYLQFRFKILSPMQDVDGQQAAETQIVGKTIISDYYVTDAATWRLREMLVDHLGIDAGAEGTPSEKRLKELLAEAPGKQLLVKLKHEASQDGKRVFHRVDSTAHV